MINAHPILGCIEIKRKKVKSGRHEKWYNRKREERCIENRIGKNGENKLIFIFVEQVIELTHLFEHLYFS